MPEFEYLIPKTLKEVCSLLQKYEGRSKIMAGGTDLLVNIKHGIISPQYLIGLKNLLGLNNITYSEDDGLRLGPLVTHRSITNSIIIKEKFGTLAVACSRIGTPQIRNMGTIGGNLCNASPSGDTAPPLIAMGATLKLVSPEKERFISLEKFFSGPGTTILSTDEIVAEIQVPNIPAHTGVVYIKLPARTLIDIAAVGVAALITLDLKSQTFRDVKIVLGAVAPTPIRAKKAEDIIRGEKIEEKLIQKAAQLASEEAHPISDVRGSANYRKEMVKVLTRQAISQALEQAKLA
jgi:carbon-monoxide dehydrogenase medium subunit